MIESILSLGYEHILVVDDGSTDGTLHILDEHFPDTKIHTVRHLINRGGGAALETGFAYIRRHAHHHSFEYVVTFDADGQHDIADLPHFLEVFDRHPHTDIVYGSRFITQTLSNVPFWRRIILM